METNKLPTAEEYLIDKGYASWVQQTSETEQEVVINYYDCLQAMIEFAKLHIEAALKEADVEISKFIDETEEECYKPQVLNCYPLSNIK